METQEQRKFGYGGDGLPPDDDDDEEAWDDGWNPWGRGGAERVGFGDFARRRRVGAVGI
jgi:hypothetical protein